MYKFICIKKYCKYLGRDLKREVGEIITLNESAGRFSHDIMKECYISLAEYRERQINDILEN